MKGCPTDVPVEAAHRALSYIDDPMTDFSDALDTSPDVRARQIAAWRRLGPARRLQIALEMSEATMQLALDGLRARNPNETRDRVRALLATRHSVSGR